MYFTRLLVFSTLCINTIVLGHKKHICTFDNRSCVVSATKVIYPKIVAGIPGVETSDPLLQDEIEVEVPDLNYKLNSAKLTGMQKVDVLDVTTATKEITFSYHLLIPVLTIESQYEVDGTLDEAAINGKGTCEIVYNDFHIVINGEIDKEKDIEGKLHTHVTKYTLDLKVDGKITPAFNGLSCGGKAASEDDMKKLEKVVRESTINGFMRKHLVNKKKTEEDLKKLDKAVHHHVISEFYQKHIGNVTDFLRIVPCSDIIAKPK